MYTLTRSGRVCATFDATDRVQIIIECRTGVPLYRSVYVMDVALLTMRSLRPPVTLTPNCMQIARPILARPFTPSQLCIAYDTALAVPTVTLHYVDIDKTSAV